ncbi:LOW QUALITY PROTEIN: hypothetical protein Q4I28_001494 [Leishmania naiffi]|uniref:Uncharacterized protein n=1 Tax=Leishmania naiffi TaxID=5678 RepID=A0AAW3C6Q2_9TRYP
MSALVLHCTHSPALFQVERHPEGHPVNVTAMHHVYQVLPLSRPEAQHCGQFVIHRGLSHSQRKVSLSRTLEAQGSSSQSPAETRPTTSNLLTVPTPPKRRWSGATVAATTLIKCLS